jgi:DnaK suppressor protein
MLKDNEIQAFKKELEEMKQQIQKNLNYSSSEMNSLRENELKDEADHALVQKGENIVKTLLDRQHETLEAIDRSLERIENGTYGICESCGNDINIERLKVKIFADYCIVCREIMEREGL